MTCLGTGGLSVCSVTTSIRIIGGDGGELANIAIQEINAMTESGKGQPEMETIKAKTKARNVLAGVSAAPEETVRAETLAERQQRIQSAWVSFLLEHPTRGGLAERLIFQSGFDAN